MFWGFFLSFFFSEISLYSVGKDAHARRGDRIHLYFVFGEALTNNDDDNDNDNDFIDEQVYFGIV